MENSKLIYEEKASGRIGKSMLLSWQATGGLAKFQFYSDRIFFSVWPRKITLRFEEIDSIEVIKNSIFMLRGVGIKINHHGRTSPFLLFWANNHEKIINLFNGKNIPVKK